MLAALYQRLALARRRYYAARPHLRRRLARPVISVGALAAGGSGKTPAAAEVARVLIGLGERPAILSRGYGRAIAPDGVTVVSDGQRILADIARAGDEPLMLARMLGRRAAVLVSADRYLAGRLAETALGATVHVLDDGFQHLALERSADLLVVDAGDVPGFAGGVGAADRSTVLREPIAAARAADAVIAVGDDAQVEAIARALEPRRVFRGRRQIDDPLVDEIREGCRRLAAPCRVLAVTAVARPRRVVEDLERLGLEVVDALVFRDHHRYDRRDLDRIAERAARLRVDAVATTEKDLVRLRQFRPYPFTLAWVPLRLAIEPVEAFRLWIRTVVANHQPRTPNRVYAPSG